MSSLLAVEDLQAGYGNLSVLHGISFELNAGEVGAMVGANGAGKSTTLRCLSGLLRPRAGTIIFAGEDISNLPAHRIVELGLVQVPEGRLLFPAMSVRENLMLGAFLPEPRKRMSQSMDAVLSYFPALREKLDLPAGSLSGGQQQMVAVGRALMSRPKLLVLDEPSLGIAPLLVREIFENIEKLAAGGLAILLIEQNIGNALSLSQRAWVIENGAIVMQGSGRELLDDPRIQAAYLGIQ
ncbi:branched-chain amino acid ABC transporter ATP-binding protein [Pseudaminobacter manganicus]|uniref:Branched-chain amino acid ABC transporter ATP-binding protein n=2 Tax=Manganibacter manganicus TaxID=1873176 RepID=A0A1V8RST3_9HYPH|nr:branched-chain amino acid ABC transporter ATP-binding protein [Pseudaminobacter manganicus]